LNALVNDGQPRLVDQRQQYVTRSDRRGDSLDEILARLDVVDILEDLFGGKCSTNTSYSRPAGQAVS
jgi:hypothetical protein